MYFSRTLINIEHAFLIMGCPTAKGPRLLQVQPFQIRLTCFIYVLKAVVEFRYFSYRSFLTSHFMLSRYGQHCICCFLFHCRYAQYAFCIIPVGYHVCAYWPWLMQCLFKTDFIYLDWVGAREGFVDQNCYRIQRMLCFPKSVHNNYMGINRGIIKNP